jgi:hypothetical protein
VEPKYNISKKLKHAKGKILELEVIMKMNEKIMVELEDISNIMKKIVRINFTTL